MSLSSRILLAVIAITNFALSLNAQNLSDSLNHLKFSLIQLEQALAQDMPGPYVSPPASPRTPTPPPSPGIPTPPPSPRGTPSPSASSDDISEWFTKLSEDQKQTLLKLSPDQLAKLLAGQSVSGPSAPPPPPPSGPGKMPPPPPIYKPKAVVQPLSSEEKERVKREYEAIIDSKLNSLDNDAQKKTYLLDTKSSLDKTIKRVQDNLKGLTGNDLFEEKKKLETARAQLAVLTNKIKPYAKQIEKEAKTQEELQQELAQKILRRRQSSKEDEE